MRNKQTITINLPVPWAAKPARIHASGFTAVIVAGALVALIVVVIACR